MQVARALVGVGAGQQVAQRIGFAGALVAAQQLRQLRLLGAQALLAGGNVLARLRQRAFDCLAAAGDIAQGAAGVGNGLFRAAQLVAGFAVGAFRLVEFIAQRFHALLQRAQLFRAGLDCALGEGGSGQRA